MGACAFALVMTMIQTGARDIFSVIPWLGLAILALWAFYWNPRVIIDDDGVRMVNVLITAQIPWRAITEVESRWALALHTTAGKFTAWAAPAAGGASAMRQARHERAGNEPASLSPAQESAHLVEARLAADHFGVTGRRATSSDVSITRHWQVTAAGAALLILGLLGAVIG